GVARGALRPVLPGGDRGAGSAGPPGASRPAIALRDRHLRLADVALLPAPQAGDDPVGVVGAPVRIWLHEPAALQEAVPWLPAGRHRLLPRGARPARRERSPAGALGHACGAAPPTDGTVTALAAPGEDSQPLGSRR